VSNVVTPPAPEFNSVFWSAADRGVTYRNYLLTLKWELISSGRSTSPLVATIDQLLIDEVQALTQARVQRLIDDVPQAEVRDVVPAPLVAAARKEPLTSGELQTFKDRIDLAKLLVDTLLASPEAIAHAFGTGPGTDAQARANLNKITAHLTHWLTQQGTMVSINRSANAGYVAFNLNRDAKSTLTLADGFFTGTALDRAGTLIHEASHGCAETVDLSPIESPYFRRLRDELALENADNYKYAVERAKELADGKPLMEPATVQGAGTAIQRFEQALDLCFYKCDKVWHVLMYLFVSYQGETLAMPDDTRVAHEKLMELGGDTTSRWWGTELTKIAAQRTLMLIEIMEFVRYYLRDPKTLAEDMNVITVTPVKHPTSIRQFDIGAGAVGDVAKLIFIQLMRGAPFTEAQAAQLFLWTDTLFADMRQDDTHRVAHHVTASDTRLYKVLCS